MAGADMGPYTIAEIVVYPLKSCKGISVSSAAISSTGFMYDREWMVVSANNGRLIAMARAPKLALVQPSLPAAAFRGEAMPHNAVMEINAPGMQVLKIPLKRSPITENAARGERGSMVTVMIFTLFEGQGVDEGPEAANWWTKYLDMPVRFVRFDSAAAKADRQAEEAPDGYVTSFTNRGQFLFASQLVTAERAGVRHLEGVDSLEFSSQSRFTNEDEPLSAKVGHLFCLVDWVIFQNVFCRQSITVQGPSAFEEDKWQKFSITHESTKLNFLSIMPRALCKVPTIDMDSQNPNVESPEPLKTMFTYRSGRHVGVTTDNGRKSYFGTYFVCDLTLQMQQTGTTKARPALAVGNTLSITEMKQGQ